MKVAIVLNRHASQLASATACEERAGEILAGCRARGIVATTHPCEGAQLSATARALADAGVDAVVAAGGDGTASAVAAGLAGTDVAFGVVPLGTLNHFARDLGIADIESALDAIAAGHIRRIDVGEVNGRVFVNNSSIGLYPEIVVRRDAEQRRRGAHRWTAMIRAVFRTLLRFPLLHVAIAWAGKVTSTHTPFVFVGNNEYAREVRSFGSRRHLDHGRIAVYTVRASRRRHMLWVMLRALFWRSRTRDFEEHVVERAEIVANRRSLRVSIDGEVVRMTPPLRYRARPGALRVLAPVKAQEVLA